MAVSRVEIVERNVEDRLASWSKRPAPAPLDPGAPVRPGAALTSRAAVSLFESMVASRCLDLEARALKNKGLGFYTIGSAGHEGNAVLGERLRPTDPCFLHYRSGGLMIARARRVPGETPLFDVMQSLVAAASDPATGGRHKAWGSHRLWVPPQTSTIASHLPKAVGMAVSIDRAKRLQLPIPVPGDAIVAASFGDASVNHNVAMSAFNTALWASYQHIPVPVLFVCEDNGIGISVQTPRGWIETSFASRPGLRYVAGDGLDLVDADRAAAEAIDFVRGERKPAFLHLRTVRLLGHAGSDVETEYRTVAEIEAAEALDPLLAAIDLVVGSGALSAADAMRVVSTTRDRVRAAAKECVGRPKLRSLAEVVAPLAPLRPETIAEVAAASAPAGARATLFGGAENLPEKHAKPRPLATLLNWALADLMAQHPEMLIFGEDVAKKGGVYHVTADLFSKFGAGRVFNTLLDETSILGLAQGAGHAGLLPVPEIQYLAYLHNAEDQLRGEACSLQFFSRGQFKNPCVVRIASFGYQKGFGGHFHNDNAIGVLRDIPGLVIAAPSRGDDAVAMLRTCVAAAKVDGAVVAFLEPIALYHEKDLDAAGDGKWQCRYPEPGAHAPIGSMELYPGDDEASTHSDRTLLIVSYANGLRLSLIAAARLRKKGIGVRVLDLRWLAPLNHTGIAEQARECGRVLVVDECRRTGGGVAEAILADLAERPELARVHLARHTAADTYVPIGPAAGFCLPSSESIEAAALELVARKDPPRSEARDGRRPGVEARA